MDAEVSRRQWLYLADLRSSILYLDIRMAVRGVVVDDAVDVQLGWHDLVDLTQGRQVRISANVTDDFGNVTGLSGRC
jgi:hypothetical protein